jgi:alkanesulfonate monooxygenase SsuD/methylene tetrahydromethanopterin reductase-like flavin-dependent oxidoreductase (luciferase family)
VAVEFWHSIPFVPIDQLVPLARILEDNGFDGIALVDHVCFSREVLSPHPYSYPGWDDGTEFADPWVAVAAMAAGTRRLKFGTHIFLLPLRHPILVAQTIATAERISGGRVDLGVGIGWQAEEFDALGIDFATRAGRTEESIQVLRDLWTGEYVEHHGKHFDFAPVRLQAAAPEPSADHPRR